MTMKILSVDKAVSILNCFTLQKPILSVAEISARTRYSKSTVSRLLATLEARGCVEKANGYGLYRLGHRAYIWGTIYEKQTSLGGIARPIMERLRDECKEQVALYVLEGHRRVCLVEVPSAYQIARRTCVGEYFPLHAGASGKVLLAYLPDVERKRLLSEIPLERFTDFTTTDPERLEENLQGIREMGYAVSRGEREAEAYSVVAPVRDASGRVIASLAISGPNFRVNEEQLKVNIRGVLAAAGEISEKLGFQKS
jgi:DNA-binding IclR family transcriptional regulator